MSFKCQRLENVSVWQIRYRYLEVFLLAVASLQPQSQQTGMTGRHTSQPAY